MPQTPQNILADAWARLAAGRARADHPFRTAALATADALGRPDLRTVVLRRVSPESRCIDFQTDHRSPKFSSLHHNGAAAWLFYDAVDAVQLRIQTIAELHVRDEVADEEWAAVPEAAKQPYCSAMAPSAMLESPVASGPLAGDGRVNFAVVRCGIESLEYLKRDDGVWHRIRFTWPNGEGRWQWLSP